MRSEQSTGQLEYSMSRERKEEEPKGGMTPRPTRRRRRGKLDKHDEWLASSNDDELLLQEASSSSVVANKKKQPNKQQRRRQSKSLQKHKNDSPSGGMEALLPSLVGVVVLAFGVMAKMGFRGRASVCGIDLGTTNSVVCVQQQGGAELTIDCVPDPATGSPIVPSVVSFLEASERQVGPSSKVPSLLHPHPTHVVVGAAAKKRIDSHPHHTLYNAKRIIGRPANDPAVAQLAAEVEFGIKIVTNNSNNNNNNENENEVYFQVPDTSLPVSPQQVGSYVVHHLHKMTQRYVGHDNVQTAVICVPAKFNARQRRETATAFAQAGIRVARIVEEPTAAALAYGLHRKPGVDYILVYDFGGGTLDISLLHVSDGFVDVMGSDGDDRLGGTDFDGAIAHYLQEGERGGRAIIESVTTPLHALEETLLKDDLQHSDLEDVLSAQCPVLQETPLCTVSSFHTIGEQLKIGLSNAYSPDKEAVMTAECLGLTDAAAANNSEEWTLETFCASLRPVELKLSSTEYQKVAQPLLDRSILPVTRLLNDLDLQVTDIDEIVMVGGTTRMPQIRQLVKEAFGVSELNTHIDPDITVAYGAASVID